MAVDESTGVVVTMIALIAIGSFTAGALTVVAWAICRAGSLADEWMQTLEDASKTASEALSISVPEFSRRTGISESTVRHRCLRGVYDADKPKGRWEISIKELERAQEEH